MTFNPRSYKRSDMHWKKKTQTFITFNPRSYKRSDLENKNAMIAKLLSIHAPTRGATHGPCECLQLYPLSIHAPTRGATLRKTQTKHYARHFQSTLLQEERQEIIADFLSLYAFNPRSYKRSDSEQTLCSFALTTFQSTLLQEERH